MRPDYVVRRSSAPPNEALPNLDFDQWQRFDMWAERAHNALNEAIREAERNPDGDLHRMPKVHACLFAAATYRELAGAARPHTDTTGGDA